MLTAIRNNYLFRGLPREVVAGIAAMSERKHYRGGDTIVRQYELSSDLLIVLEGTARIKSAQDDTLAEFGPGSMIGEISLLDEQPRSATVIASGDVEAAVIPAKTIHQYMEMDPKVSSTIMGNIARVLCRRLRTMNEKVQTKAPDPQQGKHGLWHNKRSA